MFLNPRTRETSSLEGPKVPSSLRNVGTKRTGKRKETGHRRIKGHLLRGNGEDLEK